MLGGELEPIAQSCPTLQTQGLEPVRILCWWNSPGRNTEMGCDSLLQGIFPNQGLKLGLPHCRQLLYHLSHWGIFCNARLDDSQAGIKTARRNNNNLRYVYDTTLMAESEEKLKSHLMRAKEESEKAGLKLNIQKMKILSLHGKQMGKKWKRWKILLSYVLNHCGE